MKSIIKQKQNSDGNKHKKKSFLHKNICLKMYGIFPRTLDRVTSSFMLFIN